MRASNFSLQSIELRWSDFFGPRMEVHLLGEGYVCVLEKGDFSKDPREEFGGNRRSGFRKFPRGFLTVLSRSKR